MALDYGARRTGVAISDRSETLASPLETVERVGTPAGLEALVAIVERERPELIVVGLPRTPKGEHGNQAQATAAFVGRLRRRVTVPIEWEDERFTTTIAQRTSSRSTSSGEDARAAAVLLQGVLDRRSAPA